MRIALAVSLFAAVVGTAAAQDIGGTYRIEGKNINGTTYGEPLRLP